MMVTALEELKKLMSAKAAWFRLLEGDKMVLSDQIGLSKTFLRDRTAVEKDDDFEQHPECVYAYRSGDLRS